MFEVLTPRQIDITNELLKGKSNKEIALALGLAERTVKFHVTDILKRMKCSSRTQLVVKIIMVDGPYILAESGVYNSKGELLYEHPPVEIEEEMETDSDGLPIGKVA